MGTPVSALVANLWVEVFGEIALNSASVKLLVLWKKCIAA